MSLITVLSQDRLLTQTIGHARKKHDLAGDKDQPRTSEDPRRQSCHGMIELLRQPASIELYRQRGAIVEPVNGHLKDRRGLRRFSRRGLAAAEAEFRFSAWITNLMKLHTIQQATG